MSLSNQVSRKKKRKGHIGSICGSIRAQAYFSWDHGSSDEAGECGPQMRCRTGKSPLNSPFAKFAHNVVPASCSPPLFSAAPEQWYIQLILEFSLLFSSVRFVSWIQNFLLWWSTPSNHFLGKGPWEVSVLSVRRLDSTPTLDILAGYKILGCKCIIIQCVKDCSFSLPVLTIQFCHSSQSFLCHMMSCFLSKSFWVLCLWCSGIPCWQALGEPLKIHCAQLWVGLLNPHEKTLVLQFRNSSLCYFRINFIPPFYVFPILSF